MIATAIDYETEYTDQLSIGKLGNRNYANSLSKRQIYMLSGYNPHIGKIAGPPEDFPWEQIKDENGVLVAHNMGFDWAVLARTVELNQAPKWALDIPTFCSADMCCYFYVARSLNNAVKAVFNHELDKGIRNWMKNKSWQDAIDQGKAEELLDYAKEDAYWCYKLWEQLHLAFPESERLISSHTRAMSYKGLPFDLDLAEEKYSSLSNKRFELLEKMKWTKRRDDKYRQDYKPKSKRGLASECALVGIPCPPSTSQDNPEFIDWVETYGKDHEFVTAVKDFNIVDTLAGRVKQMILRAVPDGDEHIMSYGLKYIGAESTFRFSGDTGCNVQNLPRMPKFGVYIRNFIRAKKDHTFVICDLNAIEPHLLALVLGDTETIELFKQGYNPYEASARKTMGYTEVKPLKDFDPDLYLLAKIRVLQLCYGSGWYRFYTTVCDYDRLDILDGEVTKDETFEFGTYVKRYAKDRLSEWKYLDKSTQRHWVNAWKQVTSFRKAYPLLTKKWSKLESRFKNSVNGDFSYTLLKGEKLQYFNVRHQRLPEGTSCQTRRGDKRRTWYYGAKLLENIIQREARSVFSNGLLNLIAEGYDVVMHVHDEVVVQVPKSEAKKHGDKVMECLTRPPSWIGDKLPIRAEYKISERYEK